jgi:hypothetical protein
MPVHAPFKPLFHARLLGEALEADQTACTLTQSEIAERWADSAGRGALEAVKEKQLQGQFLTEVFGSLLGYTPIVSAETVHHLEPETSPKAVKGYRPLDGIRMEFYSTPLS